jgi:ERCC4-related helicase
MNSTMSSISSNDEGFNRSSNSVLLSSRLSIDSDISPIPSLLHSENYYEDRAKKNINPYIAEDCIMFSTALPQNNKESVFSAIDPVNDNKISNHNMLCDDEICVIDTTKKTTDNNPKSFIIQDFLGDFDPKNHSNEDTFISNEQISALNLTLQPRKYQIELANLPLHRYNSVVCLRTGGGKTLVAALVVKYLHIKYKFNLKMPFKTIFIVPTRLLIEQQLKFFEKIFESDSSFFKLFGVPESDDIENYIELVDILFCTPQKLVNALQKPSSSFKLSQIDLIIFDECHHSIKNSPYNDIMKHYHYSKIRNSSSKLPQILGLTASLGCGDNKKAFDQLVEICANMDSIFVSFVQTHEQELNETVLSKHQYKLHVFPKPSRDFFTEQLILVMNLVENRSNIIISQPKGTSLYMQRIIHLNNSNKLTGDVDKVISGEYLLDFNNALTLYQDIQFEEVYQVYLKKIMETKRLKNPSTIESFIYKVFEEKLKNEFDEDVDSLVEKNKINDRNKKLQALIGILIYHVKRNKEAMGLFFL